MHLRGTIRTVTGGRAYVATTSGTEDFSVAPEAVADVMKAVVAQARVTLSVRRDVIIAVGPFADESGRS
jgi:hypothetical protein